jgi:hypothetical protein
VLFWLLLRSRKEVTEAQCRIILGLFPAFHSVRLTNNANVLELIRLVSAIPSARAAIVAERFMEIAQTVFTAKFSSAGRLEAGFFSVFFEVFGGFLTRHIRLAHELFEADFFMQTIEKIANNPMKATLKHFLKVTSTIKYDTTRLLRPHLKSLAISHQGSMTEIIHGFLDNSGDDQSYTDAIKYVLDRIAIGLDKAALVQVTINRIAGLGPTRKLLNVEDLDASIRDVLFGLRTPAITHLPHVPKVILFIKVVSKHSQEFRTSMLKALDENAAGKSAAALVLRGMLMRQDDVRSSRESVEGLVSFLIGQTLDRNIANIFLNFLGEVIGADGFDSCPWAVNVFHIFCERYFFREVSSAFLKDIASCGDGLFLVRWVAGAKDSVSQTVLAWKAGTFARLRPELKAALLQAAGIPDDSTSEAFQQFNREALRAI